MRGNETETDLEIFLPLSTRKEAEAVARRHGLSLSEFIMSAVTEKLERYSDQLRRIQ